MFDRIAPMYDTMNRAMTVGLDRRWRRLAARQVVWPGDRVLDACCGTGDLAVEAASGGEEGSSGSISPNAMLERAALKSPTIEWVQGDALALPFGDAAGLTPQPSASASATSRDLERGLRELRSVCSVRAGVSPCSS